VGRLCLTLELANYGKDGYQQAVVDAVNISIFKYTPVAGVSSNVALVLVKNLVVQLPVIII
jgi:hypothetical protein